MENKEKILKEIQHLKASGKKIVFTNGCFDIIHRGHIEYLNEAKNLGDTLVIGLNSDSSVKKLKGESRPVNNEIDRKYLLENLRSVDFVIIFSDDTPYNLISEVKPDFLVKGGDWKEEDIVGNDILKSYGGKTISLKFVDSYSSTNIINKIKQ